MEAYYPITQAQHAHCPINAQIGQAIFQELFVSLLINMGKKLWSSSTASFIYFLKLFSFYHRMKQKQTSLKKVRDICTSNQVDNYLTLCPIFIIIIWKKEDDNQRKIWSPTHSKMTTLFIIILNALEFIGPMHFD